MVHADIAAFLQRHCAVDRAGDSLWLPGWSADDWTRLLDHAQAVTLATGDVLIKRGENDRAVFFVASGALEVTTGAGRGALGHLFRERPGSVIGEISFFDGQPRTATVWATEPTSLLRLERAAFEDFADAHPAQGNDLLLALGRVLASRVRHGESKRAHHPY